MTRQFIFTVIIMSLATSGCVALQTQGLEQAPVQEQKLAVAQKLLREGRLTDALEAHRKIVQDHPNTEFAATAQYTVALIHVLAENPQKDYAQGMVEFDEFLVRFPRHQRADEARSWRQLIKNALDARKENERLSKNIEQLKQLDVKQEERRSGR